MKTTNENPIQILTPISKLTESQKEKMAEIQRRLQSEEAQKARRLLASAMSNLEAMKYVRKDIEKKVLNGSYVSFKFFPED